MRVRSGLLLAVAASSVLVSSITAYGSTILYRGTGHIVNEQPTTPKPEVPVVPTIAVTGSEALAYGGEWNVSFQASGIVEGSLRLLGTIPRGVTETSVGSVVSLGGRTRDGTFGPFQAEGKDKDGRTVLSEEISVVVADSVPPLALSAPTAASLRPSGEWNVVLSASGGVAPYDIEVSGLPTGAGISVRAVEGEAGVTLVGTAPVGEYGPVTVTVADFLGKEFALAPFKVVVPPPAGAVMAWGSNGFGQLGTGQAAASTTAPTTVVLPDGVTGFTEASVRMNHACGTGSDGAAYCWGSGSSGQLGNGTYDEKRVPAKVTMPAGLTSISGIAVGMTFSCGTGSDGAAWCWGFGGPNGQLGIAGAPSNHQTTVPVRVTMPAGVTTLTELVAGFEFVCGKGSDAATYCWGSNAEGQLGDGTKTRSFVPKKVVLPAGVPSLSGVKAGGYHACGLAPGGTAYCWGNNTYKQLGSAPNLSAGVPGAVPLPSGVVPAEIVLGKYNSCVNTADGAGYCWGWNAKGQSSGGTSTAGTPVNSSSAFRMRLGAMPIKVTGQGEEHGCGVDVNGDGYCWGANASGQIGSSGGTTSTPRKVVLPAGSKPFARILAGEIFSIGILRQ